MPSTMSIRITANLWAMIGRSFDAELLESPSFSSIAQVERQLCLELLVLLLAERPRTELCPPCVLREAVQERIARGSTCPIEREE